MKSQISIASGRAAAVTMAVYLIFSGFFAFGCSHHHHEDLGYKQAAVHAANLANSCHHPLHSCEPCNCSISEISLLFFDRQGTDESTSFTSFPSPLSGWNNSIIRKFNTRSIFHAIARVCLKGKEIRINFQSLLIHFPGRL